MDQGWDFRYRVYQKNQAIQFKPAHDKTNHFSIVWSKDKKNITEDAFNKIDKGIRKYLHQHGGKVTFTIFKACENCTYGRFEEEFEDLILGYRATNEGIYRGKDLPLNDPKHQHLKQEVVWNEEHPIIFHVHSKSCTGDEELDTNWTAMMKMPLGTRVALNFINL